MVYIHDDRDIVHKPYNQDLRKPVPIGNSYSHPRQMYHTVAKPELSPRTIVLCFDGTGDQFDADVRILGSSAFTSVSCRRLPEFERRAVLFDAEEGR